MSVKNMVFTAAKVSGLFDLASRWTRGTFGILCYHGFSFKDEHLFRPGLFQTPDLFKHRMRWLKRAGYRTLSLDEAAQRLRQGELGAKEVVITIDDGFHSVAALAVPILNELGFTATIYVTTYYVRHNNPIFRIALQYLFWKTSLESIQVGDLLPDPDIGGSTKGAGGEQTLWKLIEFGETQLDEAGRLKLARELAHRLRVDFEELVASRRLTLMNEAEVASLASQGFDIQLHTHRHRLPENDFEVKQELNDNRAVLAPLTNRPLNHLCYPSGVWSQAVWPLLASEGVDTATTCEPGLISRNTPPLAWTRFLDSQSTPQIILEAEVCGFSHLLRQITGRGSTGRKYTPIHP
jgi:peptidoglycan/xylan/chitin deacetylase (PgdA/CDA1 family)